MRKIVCFIAIGVAIAITGDASATSLHLNLQSPSDAANHAQGAFHSYPVACAKLALPEPTQYRLTIRNTGTETVPAGARLSFKTDNPHIKLTDYVSPLAIPPGEVFGGSQAGNWTIEKTQTYTQCTATAIFP